MADEYRNRRFLVRDVTGLGMPIDIHEQLKMRGLTHD